MKMEQNEFDFIFIVKDDQNYLILKDELLTYASLVKFSTEQFKLLNCDNYIFIYLNNNEFSKLNNDEDFESFIKGNNNVVFMFEKGVETPLRSFLQKKKKEQIISECKNEEDSTKEAQQEIGTNDNLQQESQENQHEKDRETNGLPINQQERKLGKTEEDNLRNELQKEFGTLLSPERLKLKQKYEDILLKYQEMKEEIDKSNELLETNNYLKNQNSELLNKKANLESQLTLLKETHTKTNFSNLEIRNISTIEYRSSNPIKATKIINEPNNLINDRSLIEIIQNELNNFQKDLNDFNSRVGNCISQITHEPNQSMLMSYIHKPSFDHNMKCSHCSNNIIGMKYQCMLCSDYNICDVCLDVNIRNTNQKRLNFHQHSSFIALKDSNTNQEGIQKEANRRSLTVEDSQVSNSIKTTISLKVEDEVVTNQIHSSGSELFEQNSLQQKTHDNNSLQSHSLKDNKKNYTDPLNNMTEEGKMNARKLEFFLLSLNNQNSNSMSNIFNSIQTKKENITPYFIELNDGNKKYSLLHNIYNKQKNTSVKLKFKTNCPQIKVIKVEKSSIDADDINITKTEILFTFTTKNKKGFDDIFCFVVNPIPDTLCNKTERFSILLKSI